MSSEAYTEIFKSIALGRSKKFGSAIANELVQREIRMKDFQIAREAVLASDEVRENLTAPIKARIQEGTYHVSADEFAEKLLRKISESKI
ncbi:MAG: flagellar biosynthesis anti-sigma factor FlgM [Lachnospiraceae bacterium]|nr:flagellar biosynthesis anti-sigma factor FlgM [Lachnospiraceae bacterium]